MAQICEDFTWQGLLVVGSTPHKSCNYRDV